MSLGCAPLGAALLLGNARGRIGGAPTKELPERRAGEPFIALTRELPGTPVHVLFSSAVACGAAAGWLLPPSGPAPAGARARRAGDDVVAEHDAAWARAGHLHLPRAC